MTILYTGRKAHLTPALKDLAAGKLAKLEKVLGDILDARVILKREKHRQMAEMVVKAGSRTLTATAEAGEFGEAVGICADRILAQARRQADRRVSRRKGRGPWNGRRRRLPEVIETDDRAMEEPVSEPEWLGRVPVPALSMREALRRARGQAGPVLVFRDAASRQVAVLLRREDGRLALLETEA